jgi:hypothetical protein
MTMNDIIKVFRLEWLGGHKLRLSFSDGLEGIWDGNELFAIGGPMVEQLRDPEFFGRAYLHMGVPAWPNGFAVDAIALHDDLLAAGALSRPRQPA